MSGIISKGHISKIMGPTDWYGLNTRATVDPSTNSGAVTPAITIDWRLRGKNGQLKVGDEVAYCLFDDGTGVIFARLDGENSGFIDYDTTTTGDVVNEKTELTKGHMTGQGGLSMYNTTGEGGAESATITGTVKVLQGDVQLSGGDVKADSISLKNHRHPENGYGGGITGPSVQ